jgi:hypothetical protein
MDHRDFRFLGIFALAFVLAVVPSAAQAQDQWLPVTAEERALTSCPLQPGAPAVYLYRDVITRDEDLSVSTYTRLKILTAAGREYANVEIPTYRRGYKLKDLKARVIPSGGEPRDFAGEVLEATVLRAGRFKITVKKFALPDVDVGAIIEYRCRFVYDTGRNVSGDSEEALMNLGVRWRDIDEGGLPSVKDMLSLPYISWQIQAPLFTVKARFVYAPFHKGQIAIFGRNMRLAWTSYGLPYGPPEMYGALVELDLRDIPAYEEEEYMAPEDSGRMGVNFFFLDNTIGGADAYWKGESANWRAAAENFMEPAAEVTAEIERLTSATLDPLARLKILYERAQQIQNLSYDRSMTARRRKELKIKDNRNAADVLKNNRGLCSDITRTLVALARRAGLPAELARVVTRDDKFFHDNLVSLYGQFDSEIAIVMAGGREWLLDPATPFCPFGLVRWTCTDTTSIMTGQHTSLFRTMPASLPEEAWTKRELALRLGPEGDLSGSAKVTFTGQEALLRRLEYLEEDEAAVKKHLQAEMAALLPSGARVNIRSVENMKSSGEDVRAVFEVEIPGFATVAGPRMLFAVSPLPGGWRRSFRHAQRSRPVYFPYPFRESDDIVIALPPGVNVEHLPETSRHERSYADHTLDCAIEAGTGIHIRRDLMIRKSLIPLEGYPVLKSFFDQVRGSEEEQVVLALPAKERAHASSPRS